MEVTIYKSEVYSEVEKLTSYYGSKMGDNNNLYDKLYTRSEDRDMLERFWRDSVNVIVDIVKPFITSYEVKADGKDQSYTSVVSGEYFYLNLSLSARHDDNLEKSISECVFAVLSYYVTASWIKLTNEELAQSCLKDLETNILNLKSKLYYKRKPTRK